MKTDVIIIGTGISGLILSVLLKEKNINHVVLNRIDKKKKLALPETIPPSAITLLENLNLLQIFEQSASKTFGYHSLWNSAVLRTDNFFHHNPYKYGFKLNKKKLLENLSELVKEYLISYSNLVELKRTETSTSVEIETDEGIQKIKSKVIVDATGRNRAVLKRLGIKSEAFDEQIVMSCHQPYFKHPKLIHSVLTETFAGGWGIVSSLNKQKNTISLYTNKESSIVSDLRDFRNWKNILSDTIYLKDFLVDDSNRKVIGGEANSSRASQIAGSNWLAVGDAAIAFDPISSHGNANAIYSANSAANAIETYIKELSSAEFLHYDNGLSQVFNTYISQKEQLYDNTLTS